MAVFCNPQEAEVTATTKTKITVTMLTGKNAGKEKKYKNEVASLLRASAVAKAAAKASAETTDDKEPDCDEEDGDDESKTRLAALLFEGDEFSDDAK